MKILLHICCARCVIYPLERLKMNYEVIGYYFNPNIHPTTEYILRGDALKSYLEKENISLLIEDYNPSIHLEIVLGSFENRCESCYLLRLKETVRKAKELGITYFSTTLLVSPYQNHAKIKEIGERLAEEEDIVFYYEDFRSGWRDSQRVADELGIYRQKYCGCIFSEYERFEKKVKRFISLG
ncbi:MAG: epoxyqueuosine reductase QueH [bacterium]|nr:epoxyqueuosine reductase QueH [bacterium]